MRTYLLAMSAAAVVAGTPLAAKDLTIQYSDLNLTTEKGQKELDRRIVSAARDYCGIDSRRVGSRLRTKGTRDCYRDAQALAREQMGRLIERTQVGG